MLIGIISPYNQVLGQSNRAKALEFYAQGGLYDAQNDPVNAIKAYLQALQYDPTSSEIHTALAADYFRIKQREEALNHAKKAVDLNPTATEALRGTIYEDKIIQSIKSKAKINKKEVSKEEAEKILKSAHDHSHSHDDVDSQKKQKDQRTVSPKKTSKVKKAKSSGKKSDKIKKVSKK